ncbi:MAG TPA: hypothetical protein VHI10_05485 [Mycobacterium sp.]|nr:hypothetical protein [Mycobacterium sp.]
MTGIWLAAMVAALMAAGVAAQLGWTVRSFQAPQWAVRRMRELRQRRRADERVQFPA